MMGSPKIFFDESPYNCTGISYGISSILVETNFTYLSGGGCRPLPRVLFGPGHQRVLAALGGSFFVAIG